MLSAFRYFSVLIFIIIAPFSLAAKPPHLAGTVDVDLHRGMISADVCLSNLPKNKALSFLLNHGFNIESVRDGHGKLLDYSGYYGGEIVGEGMQYTLSESLEDDNLCVKYTGAFPIYRDAHNTYEFKGMIAMTTQTLRATEQSKWYPVIYDPETGGLEQNVTYQLHVNCSECSAGYVNGDKPRPLSDKVFSSSLPRPLFLFLGNFNFKDVNGATYINGDVSSESAKAIGEVVKEIQHFYEDFLKTPYRDAPVFLTFQSVDRQRPIGKNTITFASYPTIAFDGRMSFDSFVETVDGQTKLKEIFWHTIAHELAHYYFGTLMIPTGPYYWFYVESAAEYMALRAVRHFLGESVYRKWLESYITRFGKITDPVRLDAVSAKHMSSDNWYYYWSLLLLGLENEAGPGRMSEIMRIILHAPQNERLDYSFLREAAKRSGVPEENWQRFEQRCVHTNTIKNCIN